MGLEGPWCVRHPGHTALIPIQHNVAALAVWPLASHQAVSWYQQTEAELSPFQLSTELCPPERLSRTFKVVINTELGHEGRP